VTDAEALLELGHLDPLTRLDVTRQQGAPQALGDAVDDADALDGVVVGWFDQRLSLRRSVPL
jgi:hypothetical protein